MADIQRRCFDDIRRAVETLGSRRATEQDVQVFWGRMREVAKRDEAHAAVIANIFAQLVMVADNEFKRNVYRRVVDDCCALFDRETGRRLAMLPGPRDVKETLLKLAEGGNMTSAELNMVRMRYARLFGEIALTDGDVAMVQWVAGGELVHRVIERAFTRFDDADEVRLCVCTVLASAATFIARPTVCAKMKDVETRRMLREEVNRKWKTLMNVTKLCSQLKPDTPRFAYKPKVKAILEGVKSESVVALGVLYWVTTILMDSKSEDTLLFTLPMCLGFVDAVAEFHAGLRWRAVQIIHAAFRRRFETVDIAGQVRDKCVEAYAAMVGRGLADLVLEHCFEYAEDRTIDDSHIRALVRAILDRVKPPFTRQFAFTLNRFITHSRVFSVANRDRGTKELVDVFLREMRHSDVR